MPYIYEICKAGKILEISKYYTARWNCKGERRKEKESPSTEAQLKVNLRQMVKKLRRLLNANFVDGDLLIALDYKKELRPKDSDQMQEHIRKFLRKLRAEYKKQGIALKYVYVKEIGPKGGTHVHMVLNCCNNATDIILKCWRKGGIHIDPLNTDGQYEKIADYFVKYADKTAQTEGKHIGKAYYPSKGLKQPEVKKRIVKNVDTFREKVTEKKGYYLEKSSVVAGVNEAGFGYFSYSLHRIKDYKDEGEDG